MRIHVKDGYFVGFGRWIAPGDYNEGDAGLFGMEAGYLASNGHATVLEDVATPITDEEAATLPDAELETVNEDVDLESMTIAELRAFATDSDIDLSKARNKAEIIDVIHSAYEQTAEETDDDEG